MGLFGKKQEGEVKGIKVKGIHDGMWGYMVSAHKIDVDMLSKEYRCVEREGKNADGEAATLVRVFKPQEASQKGIAITSWETFDQYPELVWFEGYLTHTNKAYLERKRT